MMRIEKEYSKATLMNMSKTELVELVKVLAYNNNVMFECINHQAKYVQQVYDFISGERSDRS